MPMMSALPRETFVPFTPPFTDKYTKGDLFYGFGIPRLSLMKFLNVPTSESGPSALFMINNYLGTGDEIMGGTEKVKFAVATKMLTVEDEFKKKYPGFDDVKSLPFKDPRKKNLLEEITKAFAIAEPKIKADLEEEMLKPHQDFWAALRKFKNGKYATAMDYKRAGTTPADDAAENDAWRKKCKGGIYHGTHVLNKTVHFCLSLEQKTNDVVTGYTDMDFSAVVKKTSPTDTPATATHKLRLITPAELRWVYRHRDDESVKKNIQFWTHGAELDKWTPCGPPWEKDDPSKALWASYKPKSASVHKGD